MEIVHEEQLAVLDLAGNPTGEGVDRKKAHREGILHGASHIFICKWESDTLFILLQRRSLCKDSYPGCLDISSAGHMEFGSSFLDTACKELQEELGITAKPGELVELFTQTIRHDEVFHGEPFVDREINKVYLLDRDVDIAELHLQEAELSEVVWMSAQKALARLDHNDRELCMLHDEFRRAISAIHGYYQKQGV